MAGCLLHRESGKRLPRMNYTPLDNYPAPRSWIFYRTPPLPRSFSLRYNYDFASAVALLERWLNAYQAKQKAAPRPLQR